MSAYSPDMSVTKPIFTVSAACAAPAVNAAVASARQACARVFIFIDVSCCSDALWLFEGRHG